MGTGVGGDVGSGIGTGEAVGCGAGVAGTGVGAAVGGGVTASAAMLSVLVVPHRLQVKVFSPATPGAASLVTAPPSQS